jgi:hypothetical protein
MGIGDNMTVDVIDEPGANTLRAGELREAKQGHRN